VRFLFSHSFWLSGFAPAEHRVLLTWAQYLKQVFGIDIEACLESDSAARINICIEEGRGIDKSLNQLDAKAVESQA
jgi:hypothetical protein